MNKPLKILILEDNPEDAFLLERELKNSGLQYESQTVHEKDEFEIALGEFKPDIVLSDFSLISFDGLTAFRITRDKNIDVPFIIVSGSIGEEKAVELIKSGVTDYALKDKLITIHSKIDRAMNDYQSRKEKKEADEKIRIQNSKLIEIANFQSHIVRTPICQMLGLFNLIDYANFSNPENATLINHLKDVANNVDKVIRKIVDMTHEVEHMIDGSARTDDPHLYTQG